MPRILIIGASGYTGQALVRLATAAGHAVIAHLRPDSPHLAAHRAAFTELGATVAIEPWEKGAITDLVARAQPNLVFALLGTTAARARAAARAGLPPADYAAVDSGLTLLLLEAVLAAAPSARFVYLSSAGAGGTLRNAYLDARAQVEAALAASELAWTVARPSFITGPDRDDQRLGERVGAAVLDGLGGLLGAVGAGSLVAGWRSIDATHLARALLRAGTDASYAGRTLEAAELQALAR